MEVIIIFFLLILAVARLLARFLITIKREFKQQKDKQSYAQNQKSQDKQHKEHIRKIKPDERDREHSTSEVNTNTFGNRMTPYVQHIFYFGNHLRLCSRLFFDIESPNDQKLTLYDERKEPIETDTIDGLRKIQSKAFIPLNHFIIYQHWGDGESDDGVPYRLYTALEKSKAENIAKILKCGQVKNFIFICTMFMPGAIRTFTDIMLEGTPHYLDMLGFFWGLSGDDMTDEVENAYDIADAANRLKIKRLSILTAEFDSGCENRLAEGLRGNSTLRRFGVFRNDERNEFPRFPTPIIDAAIRMDKIDS